MHSAETGPIVTSIPLDRSLGTAFLLAVAVHCLAIGLLWVAWPAPTATPSNTLQVRFSTELVARSDLPAAISTPSNLQPDPITSVPAVNGELTVTPADHTSQVANKVPPAVTESQHTESGPVAFDPRSIHQFLDSTARETFESAVPTTIVEERYKRQWHRRVQRIGQLNYPANVRRDGLSGLLTLEIAIATNGALAEVSVKQSSGYSTMDRAAVEIVRTAAPFEPLPPNLPRMNHEFRFLSTWEFQR